MITRNGQIAWVNERGRIIVSSAEGAPPTFGRRVAVHVKGSLWTGGERGLARLDGRHWKRWPGIDWRVVAMAVGPDEGLWVAGVAGGSSGEPRIAKIDPAHGSVADVSHGLPRDGMINAIAVAPDGTLWVALGRAYWDGWKRGSGPRSLARFDGTWTFHRPGEGSPVEGVIGDSGLAVTPDGAVWAAVQSADPEDWAITRFDGKTWTTYRNGDGPLTGRLSVLTTSPDGALWVGSCAGPAGGISSFAEGVWSQDPIGCVFSLTVTDHPTVWAEAWSGMMMLTPPQPIGAFGE